MSEAANRWASVRQDPTAIVVSRKRARTLLVAVLMFGIGWGIWELPIGMKLAFHAPPPPLLNAIGIYLAACMFAAVGLLGASKAVQSNPLLVITTDGLSLGTGWNWIKQDFTLIPWAEIASLSVTTTRGIVGSSVVVVTLRSGSRLRSGPVSRHNLWIFSLQSMFVRRRHGALRYGGVLRYQSGTTVIPSYEVIALMHQRFGRQIKAEHVDLEDHVNRAT